MPENIELYNHAKFGQLRMVEIEGEPWFVAKDVCGALGYANHSKAINDHVDDEDKLNNETLSSLGQRGGWLINESGIYSLILHSRMPHAKAFKHWVTHEVLPSIRKHGVYATPETAERLMSDPDFMIKTFTTLKEERERRAMLEAKNAEMAPKALFADAVAASHTSILVGELAKILRQNGVDMGQNRLFEWMREEGWLMKQGSWRNMPTQRAMDMGLFEIKETSITHSDGHVTVSKTPKVTGKGQQYFVNLFVGEVA